MRPGHIPRIIPKDSDDFTIAEHSFNEAGAHTPDNTDSKKMGRPTRQRASMRPGHIPRIIRHWKAKNYTLSVPGFNEAGAHTPDNTKVFDGRMAWTIELQ